MGFNFGSKEVNDWLDLCCKGEAPKLSRKKIFSLPFLNNNAPQNDQKGEFYNTTVDKMAKAIANLYLIPEFAVFDLDTVQESRNCKANPADYIHLEAGKFHDNVTRYFPEVEEYVREISDGLIFLANIGCMQSYADLPHLEAIQRFVDRIPPIEGEYGTFNARKTVADAMNISDVRSYLNWEYPKWVIRSATEGLCEEFSEYQSVDIIENPNLWLLSDAVSKLKSSDLLGRHEFDRAYKRLKPIAESIPAVPGQVSFFGQVAALRDEVDAIKGKRGPEPTTPPAHQKLTEYLERKGIAPVPVATSVPQHQEVSAPRYRR